MYTKEEHEDGELFSILDEQGDWICNVLGEEQSDALLSHLNR